MNRFIEEFHTHAQSVRLTDAERSRIRTKLRSSMRSAPVPSPFFPQHFFFSRMAVAAFVVVILVGGGTAYAAAGALPGDILYPIKTDIDEPVQGALAFSTEAKASWNASVAQTRLDEAQALAQKGMLTASTSAELAANFTEHASAVVSLSRDIQTTDPSSADALTTRFSSLVTSKGAAILAAGKGSDNPETTQASGVLVLNITDGQSSEGAVPAAASVSARPVMFAAMAKAPTPSVQMSADLAASSTDDESSIESLSVQAHAALDEASSTLAHGSFDPATARDAAARIASLENRIVNADASLQIGSMAEAADDFDYVLNAALDIQSTLTPHQPNEGNTSTSAAEPPIQHTELPVITAPL